MPSHRAAIAAERTRKLAWCCAAVLGALAVSQEAALAQDAPRPVCVAAADADTGPVAALGEVPGGMLIGAEKGLFLARAAGGKVTVTPLHGEKGWFLARAHSGKIALTPVATVAPATPGGLMPVRSIRSLPGGSVLIEGYVWFLAREADGKLTIALAGDANTGVVDAIGDLSGGALLLHTEDKGWFLGRMEDGKLAVAPAGDADTGRVFQMKRVGSAVLISARNGLFVGRVGGGKVAVTPAGVATGQLFQMRDFADGLLISAERGLFFAREQDGNVVIARAGADTGPAHAEGIHQLPGGGTLIATTRKRWFLARAAGGKVTLTPAGVTDPGRISLMRDFAGGVLIAAERGVFVAGPAGAKGCAGQ